MTKTRKNGKNYFEYLGPNNMKCRSRVEVAAVVALAAQEKAAAGGGGGGEAGGGGGAVAAAAVESPPSAAAPAAASSDAASSAASAGWCALKLRATQGKRKERKEIAQDARVVAQSTSKNPESHSSNNNSSSSSSNPPAKKKRRRVMRDIPNGFIKGKECQPIILDVIYTYEQPLTQSFPVSISFTFGFTNIF